MTNPKHRPQDSHCRECGARLEVEHPARTRVRGLFDRRRWQENMVCPDCRASSGGGRSVMLTARHPPRNSFMRMFFWLGSIRHHRQDAMLADASRSRNLFRGGDGRPELAKLLEAATFPVYGFKDRPMGLRLKSRGWGGHGDPMVINRIHLGYVAGHPRQPEKGIDLAQGPAVDAGMNELVAIQGVVHTYVSEERRKSYFQEGNLNRDWNQRRIENTPRQQATARIAGMDVEVSYMSWDEPQRIILARFNMAEGHSLQAASLNVSWPELQEIIGTLVPLKEDQEILEEYREDVEEVQRQLYESHDEQAG